MRRVTLVALVLLLAGCADPGGASGDDTDGDDFGDLGVQATDTQGVLVGIVVDEAIRPIAGAQVTLRLPDGSADNQTTDDTGRFAYGNLDPGTYFVEVKHLLYATVQTSAEVVAGDADPPVLRVQLQRLFTQEAFSEVVKFEGFIQCGYVLVIISSLCLNDYSTLVIPGGVAPWLRDTLDRRGYVSAVGAGWQSIVFEMQWEPSTGTSSNMFILSSFYNRTASDWYGQTGGTSPLLLRFEVGVENGASGAEDLIPAEGRPDLYTFGGIDGMDQAGGSVGFGFNQQFTIFQHNFYYGKPPEGWSFIAGDLPPF